MKELYRMFNVTWRETYMVVGMGVLFSVFLLGGCALTNEVLHNRYVGDKETMVYHKELCEKVKKIDPRQISAFPYNSAARYEGYKPCDKCNPDK